MTFWQNPALEPKRSYRFTLTVAGLDTSIPSFLISKVNKPSFSLSESEHKYLNHTFYYPGRLTWNDVSFTIVDVIDAVSNGSQAVMKMIQASGYAIPVNAGVQETISKSKSVGALGTITIHQLDSEGTIVEDWVLNNAWIKDVKFGDLDYGSEDMQNVEVTVKYDNAFINVFQGDGRVPTNAVGGTG
jgi:hypothetical protein